MPDYLSILQEFVWQTMDIAPDYPRISKFLEYWEIHIEAPIHKVTILNSENISVSSIKNIDKLFKL